MGSGARRILPVLCICAGLFGGQALGTDFHVTLECSADAYALGDSVRFTWRNDTDSTVVAGNHPPYDIYTDTGELIFWGPLPWEYHLGPHSLVELSWDQLDGFGAPVPPGSYVVRISYVFNDTPPGYGVADDFVIQAPASAPEDDPRLDADSWGKVKSAYR